MIEETIEITISDNANVDWIRGKVRDEEFASEADVVAHSIALLREEDAKYERWLVESSGRDMTGTRQIQAPPSRTTRPRSIWRSGEGSAIRL